MIKFFLYVVLLFTTSLNIAAPLPANDVFQIAVHKQDINTFVVDWQIKPGYFLYKDRIHFTTASNDNAQLGTIYFPKPIIKTDKLNHAYPIYREQIHLPVAILGKEPGEVAIKAHFQGCSDEGFCYPPQTSRIKLTINLHLELNTVELENNGNIPLRTPSVKPAKPSRIETLFASNNWTLIIIGFFCFGLLLAFTPCILPMVPILSGIIVGHGTTITKQKALLLSLSYVLSMSFTYAAIGAAIALMGSNLQIAMQTPWAIGIFSGIFILLALSMFNVYELRLPVTWQSKLAGLTRNQSSGHYLSAAFMGCMSTLILSPCVTAPMLGALSYIASSGNVLLGILALFFLSLGMGTPLILVGISAGKLLPKTGRWMNNVKTFFGILFLAIAVYLLMRILPALIIMMLWSGLLIFIGLYLGALSRAITNSARFAQGLGIILLIYGILILIGASKGNTNPLQPLATSSIAETSTPFTIVKTVDEAKKAMIRAKGKPIMLDFYADWCTACKVMAVTTLKEPEIEKSLQRFMVIKVDLTPNNADTQALLRYFDIIAPPTFLFFDTEGHALNDLRIVGEVSTETFMKQLELV